MTKFPPDRPGSGWTVADTASYLGLSDASVHQHFDDMVIHPPTHYLVIGTLMRWGWTLTHAAAADSDPSA